MLKTNFLGLELKNPVIIAAGPWNRDGAALKASLAAGAGAVVTESIVSDTLLDVPKATAVSLSPAYPHTLHLNWFIWQANLKSSEQMLSKFQFLTRWEKDLKL